MVRVPAGQSCSRQRHPIHALSRGGFTLVEMLVAVAVVLLLMTMFAQVYEIAGSTITRQRGIAENDQRSRTLQNQLKADLDKRTFRLMMPWMRNVPATTSMLREDGHQTESQAHLRQGYFYISENDPQNDSDDMLQFTIHVGIETKNKDFSPTYGKATAIPGANNLTQYPNQPETDDGWPVANGASLSRAAEVSYFLRGNKLYRRVLLLRDPLPSATTNTQPGYLDTSGSSPVYRDFFDPSQSSPVYSATGPFWNDFDFSAFYFGNLSATPPVPHHAFFHGLSSLDNASDQTQFPLGNPRYRFGHYLSLINNAPYLDFNGCSREFDSSGRYFGRFTHEETSSEYFRYPQALADHDQNPSTAAINPHFDNPNDPSDNLSLAADDVFDSFRNGPRRGEDLILSNVHAFDVKVWDPYANNRIGAFVDIGGSDVTQQHPAVAFAMNQRLNTDYGPRGANGDSQNRVFDTWHSKIDLKMANNGTFDLPPFYHLRYTPDVPGAPLGLEGKKIEVWQPKPPPNDPNSYKVGDLVFPTQGLPPNDHQRPNGWRFYYRCVSPATGPATTEPTKSEWPAVAGARFTEPGSGIIWEAVENWVPLQAIQITIRFWDVTSNQMRQMTIVHSLVD